MQSRSIANASPVKVLFWVSPITEMACPLQKMPWIRVFLPRIQNAFAKAGYDIDSTVVASEHVIAECGRLGVKVDGRLVGIPQGELLGGYRFNALEETVRYHERRGGSPFFANLGGVAKKALGGEYRPDVVISFSASPFFRDIYPSALLLYHEYGMLSRRPYPETFFFDPCGTTSRNFVAVHTAQINAVPAERPFLDELCRYRAAIRGALCSNELLDAYFTGIRRRFRKLLLLPTGYEGFADARLNFPYQTQLEYVEHVLANVPKDVAVVLTQHPHVRAFSDETVSSLKALNGNLFSEPWYGNVQCFSQIAIVYCDACVTQSSSLGYQAIFHEKLFFSIGGFCEGVADARSVEEIPAALERRPMTRDNFLVWVLRNHVVDDEDLPSHLRRLLTAWGKSPETIDKPEDWPEGCSPDGFRRRINRWMGRIAPPKLNGAEMQVYFDLGKGFSEDFKLTWRIAEGPKSFHVEKKIPLPEGCVAIRFDPTEKYFVEVTDLHLIGKDGDIPLARHNGGARNGTVSFRTLDPWLVFKTTGDDPTVLLKASVHEVEDPGGIVKALTRDLNNSRREVSETARKLADREDRLQQVDDFVQQVRQAIDDEMHRQLLAKAEECGKLETAVCSERTQRERLERDLSAERAEKARLADELGVEQKARAQTEQSLESARKRCVDLVSSLLDCRHRARKLERGRLSSRIGRGIAWMLPYGGVTAWKKADYGIAGGGTPDARMRDCLRFLLPHGVVQWLRRRDRRRLPVRPR